MKNWRCISLIECTCGFSKYKENDFKTAEEAAAMFTVGYNVSSNIRERH